MGLNPPLVLFGAFDRHNLGDLLFPHLIAAQHPGRELHYAGLVARDLSQYGGHEVRALPDVLAALAGRPFELIHVGGELLTCDAWTAAVMLETDEGARAAIAAYDRDPPARMTWAAQRLGTARLAPYVLDKARLPGCARLRFNAVGGVGLDGQPDALRTEVLAALAHADEVTVREAATLASLRAAGIAAQLAPDPVAALDRDPHAATIRARAAAQRTARGPYLAVQFSADFGDDATLAALAAGLRIAAGEAAIVLFRAGGAPWHDAPEPYARLQARLGAGCRIFEALDIWEICALIAGARTFIGSSLHGQIVARAFGVPAIGIERRPGAAAKLRAWCASWAPQARIVAAEALAGAGE